MFEKKGPYVVLPEGFSSPYVEKAPSVANQVPYVTHMQPICGPYVSALVVYYVDAMYVLILWLTCTVFYCSSLKAVFSIMLSLIFSWDKK